MPRRAGLLLSFASPVLAHVGIAGRPASWFAGGQALAGRRAILHGSAAAAASDNANLPTVADLTDPREWLEDVEGDAPLAWVRERNAHALQAIGEPSEGLWTDYNCSNMLERETLCCEVVFLSTNKNTKK